ncbi:hypothetical protein WJX79_001712 [Trebouxia sp. C0005]
MHFRIPQALDSFVAAAVAGHVVSKPAFARAGAKTDLHSLQPHLRPQQDRPQGYPGRQLDWSEDCCAEAYSMLCTVSAAGWPSRTLLLLLARFLSRVGAAVVQEATNGCNVAEGGNPSTPGGQPIEVSLGLTIFFTCQMLKHTEQWLHSPEKDTAPLKKVKGDVAQHWLEMKASALQDLLAYQAAVNGGCLSSAADQRNAGNLIWSTVVELAASDWQPLRGKGNKGHQQDVQAAITGILAKPFLLAHSNAAAASEALPQLLAQKDQKADHAHQQAAALTVMLEYASKGAEQQVVMLELFSCKMAAHAALSDSIKARKLAVELAGRQMSTRPHHGALFDAALLLLKAGAQDKDANIRVKAIGIAGSTAADTRLRSQHSHAELVVLLTHRLLDTSVMVRKAVLQAVQLVVQSFDQAGPLPTAACNWPLYIRLAETLCSMLTAAPDSSLASQELQQAARQAWLPACGASPLQAWHSFLGTCSTPQVERMAGIMVSARHECCALLQQSYQQLYNLLGAVEGEERTAMVTPEQACSIAAALKVTYVLGGVSQKAQDVPGQVAIEVLYSLPKPQQATVRALKQLETALLQVLPDVTANMVLPSESAHTAVTTSEISPSKHAEEMAMQRLTVSYLLLLGHMADNYKLEKAAFLKQLFESHGALAGQDADEAALHSPISPGVSQTAKRPKTGKINQASETAEGFDYMQAGKESSQAAALAQEYMDKLLDESAPASYLPMLARLARTCALPVAIRVAALRSLGKLSVLAEGLSLQYSPLISSILSTIQDVASNQVEPEALMRSAPDCLEGQKGQDSLCRAHNDQLSSQANPTQRTADPSEGSTGTSAVLADASEGPTDCSQGPSEPLQQPSAPSQADADKLSQLPDQLEPASGQNSQMIISGHAQKASSADHDAAVTKKAIKKMHISTELMLLDTAPSVSEVVEAAAEAVHAESVLLEAIHVATVMVNTYPHVHDDMVSALANGLRQALGGVAPTAITRALAVAVASLMLHERFKWGQAIGLLGEAIASDNPQASALMKHVFQHLQRSKPSQRHKLLLDLHTQTPAPNKLPLNRVLVGELMTNADMRADALISPALQNVLLMLSASEAQGLAAGADLLQHLVPSQKHLTMLHRHVQDNPDTLQHCSEQVVAHLVNFVRNFAGPVQATSEGPSKTDAGSKRASKAVQSALLTALQALRPSSAMQKGRKAKRKVVREQESVHTGQSRDELQLYKQAVAKMKETSGMPKVGRITDLFKES